MSDNSNDRNQGQGHLHQSNINLELGQGQLNQIMELQDQFVNLSQRLYWDDIALKIIHLVWSSWNNDQRELFLNFSTNVFLIIRPDRRRDECKNALREVMVSAYLLQEENNRNSLRNANNIEREADRVD